MFTEDAADLGHTVEVFLLRSAHGRTRSRTYRCLPVR
jgi:hypothetical protein